jgi:hypothetical protein
MRPWNYIWQWGRVSLGFPSILVGIPTFDTESIVVNRSFISIFTFLVLVVVIEVVVVVSLSVVVNAVLLVIALMIFDSGEGCDSGYVAVVFSGDYSVDAVKGVL